MFFHSGSMPGAEKMTRQECRLFGALREIVIVLQHVAKIRESAPKNGVQDKKNRRARASVMTG
ncbi:hypothetical protein CKO_04192 [Citrobacter koseri ATCC BAA-895]|uniref:Uncharacterized protein n=1 Tax=Citrobacter koseri (strain ATCC BAA-895 / CDC 4225-83 / SGSC4696) TaxID=290338 RepID=A8AP41_CITK8|nr:hypothetical protein CKO_04192 [Citrobacter koseri ATCC BAA-895]